MPGQMYSKTPKRTPLRREKSQPKDQDPVEVSMFIFERSAGKFQLHPRVIRFRPCMEMVLGGSHF